MNLTTSLFPFALSFRSRSGAVRVRLLALVLVLCGLPRTHGTESMVMVQSEHRSPIETGVDVRRDVVLTNAFQSYTVRYEAIEPRDTPNRILPKKWAPTIGYTPIGLAGPSMALWYNQGFFLWTMDDVNLKDYRPTFTVVRQDGADATIAYHWDTPKAKVTVYFSMVDTLDKLIMRGHIEPKTEIKKIALRLMAYPGTFAKPWNRRATTAKRTLAQGRAQLDLDTESWVLLEDVTKGRPADGPAGLLLGDTSAFASVVLDGIGGYAEYVDLTLAPGCHDFVLGLYEQPGGPGTEETRKIFRREGSIESKALAALAKHDFETPLPPIASGDPARLARIKAAVQAREKTMLERPAERWQPRSEPLDFPWLAHLSGPPIRIGLLCPRWAAYETMEWARRIKLDVRHQYFDSADALCNAGVWPYRFTTGIGPLNASMAARNLRRICLDPERDVIVISGVHANALSRDIVRVIATGIRERGLGLLLCGGSRQGWPAELFATPAPHLVDPIRQAFPDWQRLPGLEPGGNGRRGDTFPVEAWRYGRGTVVHWRVNMGPYSALTPANHASEGLAEAEDRAYAMTAMALLAAAGKTPPSRASLSCTPAPKSTLRLDWSGQAPTTLQFRVRDDLDREIAHGTGPLDALRLPSLPGGRSAFIDAILRNDRGEAIGLASTVVDNQQSCGIESIELQPGRRIHEVAVPMIEAKADGVTLRVRIVLRGDIPAGARLVYSIHDAFDRLLASGEKPAAPQGASELTIALPPAMAICHRFDVALAQGNRELARERQRFTVPSPYPYEDFTALVWSYARREPVTRRVQRLCYEAGADSMDLCHMRGYTDSQAATEYEVAARSGLRLVPYVTRIANKTRKDRTLAPGLFNREWIAKEKHSIRICSRQAVPYRPAAYTLGDENYLARRGGEFGAAPAAMAAFRTWLQKKYPSIAKLNHAWGASFASFKEISEPAWLADVTADPKRFPAWFDHRAFYDGAFAGLHETFADVIRAEDPGAKVGWDGLLSYTWQSGYDFYALSRNLNLNQTYTTHPFQGELVRSFAAPNAFTGEWGNAVADTEAGFRAILWYNLFRGHNSCWWWTSWGCDYTPFNPDTSPSHFGTWFFDELQEIRGGIGRLLLHARRADSSVAILYNQTDIHAARLTAQFCPKAAFASDTNWEKGQAALLHLLADLGFSFHYIARQALAEDPAALDHVRLLVLPLATSLSDDIAETLRAFVQKGGFLLADGRVGILDADGALRDTRPLDALFGVVSPAGIKAFSAMSGEARIASGKQELDLPVLEPALLPAPGSVNLAKTDVPLCIHHTTGRGETLLLNFPFAAYNSWRDQTGNSFPRHLLRQTLAAAGIRPDVDVETSAGPDVTHIEQCRFRDDNLSYLCLQQDIFQRTDAVQTLKLSRPSPIPFLYDARAGKLLGTNVRTWTTDISRGTPKVFALLPYRVTGLTLASMPAEIRRGQILRGTVGLRTDTGRAGYHVVHLRVRAPNASRDHRQYSRTISCQPEGAFFIPFALNDPVGTWHLQFRDAATGVATDLNIELH